MALTPAQWEQHDKERMQNAVAELLASPNGCFFLLSLRAAFGVHSTPFNADPYISAYAAGRHSCGKDLEATLVAAKPEALLVLGKFELDETRLRQEDE